MVVQQEVEKKLTEKFQPHHLQVINESHQHNVPSGSESHFKVILVTDAFNELRQVGRHQLVYAELAEQMAGEIHALALHTYTNDEWQQRQKTAPDSPECLGGSKAG